MSLAPEGAAARAISTALQGVDLAPEIAAASPEGTIGRWLPRCGGLENHAPRACRQLVVSAAGLRAAPEGGASYRIVSWPCSPEGVTTTAMHHSLAVAVASSLFVALRSR